MKLKLGRGQRRNRRAQLAVDARAERRRAASQRVYAVLAAVMSTAFKTYEAAYNAAVRKAREHVEAGLSSEQCEMGLEYNSLYREWMMRMLPLPQNRYGSETRCEVVRACDPLMKEG